MFRLTFATWTSSIPFQSQLSSKYTHTHTHTRTRTNANALLDSYVLSWTKSLTDHHHTVGHHISLAPPTNVGFSVHEDLSEAIYGVFQPRVPYPSSQEQSQEEGQRSVGTLPMMS